MKLRNEWRPAELNARNTADDFYNPTNADGVGDRLKNDMPERLQEYAENATLFFESDALDPHYTYAFLNGIREAIQNHRGCSGRDQLGRSVQSLLRDPRFR